MFANLVANQTQNRWQQAKKTKITENEQRKMERNLLFIVRQYSE